MSSRQGFRPPPPYQRGGKMPPPPMPGQPPAHPLTQVNVQAGEGRMMMRMLIIQVVQG